MAKSAEDQVPNSSTYAWTKDSDIAINAFLKKARFRRAFSTSEDLTWQYIYSSSHPWYKMMVLNPYVFVLDFVSKLRTLKDTQWIWVKTKDAPEETGMDDATEEATTYRTFPSQTYTLKPFADTRFV